MPSIGSSLYKFCERCEGTCDAALPKGGVHSLEAIHVQWGVESLQKAA